MSKKAEPIFVQRSKMAISSDLFELKDIIQRSQEALHKAEEWATAGLLADERHHKQYCLEQILTAIGVDLDKLRTELNKDGYGWEPGVIP